MAQDSRQPPADREAERALLGALLRDNGCFPAVAGLLDPEAMYSFGNQKILEGIGELLRSGKPADPVTIGNWLSSGGYLADIGGPGAIVDIWSSAPAAANAVHYAEIIQKCFVRRKALTLAAELLDRAADASVDVSEMLEAAGKELFGLSVNAKKAQAVSLQVVMEESFTKIVERTKSDRSCIGVPSGFGTLDRLTGGWREAELIIVAARPSAGKTTIAGNFFLNAAIEDQVPALFVTIEQPRSELGERFIASRASIDSTMIRDGTLCAEHMDVIARTVGELSAKGTKAFVSDLSEQTVESIGAEARRLHMTAGIRLLVIDYLQLINVSRSSQRETRQEQVSAQSRYLKLLAKELRIPVIVLAQLNRDSDKQNRKPRVSDLRESGAIEQDADVVILMWNPKQEMDGFGDVKQPKNGPIEVIVGKNRNGKTGEVKLFFQRELLRFNSWTKGDEEFQ